MTTAENNNIKVYASVETTEGVVPTSGTVETLRFNSYTLVTEKGTTQSDEIKNNNLVPDYVMTSLAENGSVGAELSIGSHDIILNSLFDTVPSKVNRYKKVKGVNVAVTSTSQITISGLDYTDYFTASTYIRLGGFTTVSNNNYFLISSVALSGSDTVVTVSGTPLTVETASVYTYIEQANDVIILNNTDIEFTATGLDSGGNNAFAAGIAAGTIATNQRIFVEGAGYESGTFTLTGQPADGDTVVISDGVKSVTFEFDSNSSVSSTNNITHTAVTIGVDANTTAANLAAAINAQRLEIEDVSYFTLTVNLPNKVLAVATASTNVVTVKNLRQTGGTLTDTSANITTVNFTGGIALRTEYKIISASDDALTTSPAPAGTLAAGANVTIKGIFIRDPSETPGGSLPYETKTISSYSLERGSTDINAYSVATGSKFGTTTITLPANDKITFETQVMGIDRLNIDTTTTLGDSGTYTILDYNTPIMTSANNLGVITFDGTVQACIRSGSIVFSRDLRRLPLINKLFSKSIKKNRKMHSLNLEFYVIDNEDYKKMRRHDKFEVVIEANDGNNNKIIINFPEVCFGTYNDPVSGLDQDLIATTELKAAEHDTEGYAAQICSFSNVSPIAAV